MKTERARQLARLGLVGIATLGLLAPTQTYAAKPDVRTESKAAMREANGLKLQEMAEAEGALGVYVDEATDEYVVVVPAAGQSRFVASDSASLGVPVRVETRDIDAATTDRIGETLEAMAPDLAGHAFGFGFDPKSGKVILRSDAPESAFAAVLKTFPGKIIFREAKFEQTSMANDGQPHWGGAKVAVTGGGNVCTSGFAIRFNASGGRYMITAGHCFTNGQSTSMGTAVREAEAWPYWDFEFIKGHTVAGYVYDSSTHGRPVSNASNPTVGSTYCTTGITSGVPCDWSLKKLNQTLCNIGGFPSGSCQHNLAEFRRPSGTPVQPGDSGGPLWFKYSSTAGIRGVVSLHAYDAFEGWNSYATQYQTIADYYRGVAIVP